MNAQELEKTLKKLEGLRKRRDEKQKEAEALEDKKLLINAKYKDLKAKNKLTDNFKTKRNRFNQQVATSKITVKTVDKQIEAHLDKYPELRKDNPKTDEQYHLDDIAEMSKPMSPEKIAAMNGEAAGFGLPRMTAPPLTAEQLKLLDANTVDEPDEPIPDVVEKLAEIVESNKPIVDEYDDEELVIVDEPVQTQPTSNLSYYEWLDRTGSLWLSQGRSIQSITGALIFDFGYVAVDRRTKLCIIADAVNAHPKSIGLQVKHVYNALANK